MQNLQDPVSSQAARSTMYVYFIAFIAAVGGFLFGFDLSIISGAIIFLKREFALSSAQVGFAISSAALGCILGPLIGYWLSDFIGRKRTLVFTAILFGISAVGTALPRNMFEFNCFRIIGGVAVGLAAIVSPMYIAEIAPARIRGRLVTINQLAIGIGALTSIIVSYFLSLTEAWRWMFASECVPVICLLVGLIFIPRSPRWLAQKNKLKEARDVLTKIDGPEHAEIEMLEISASIDEETGTFSELFQPGIRIGLLIAVALAFFQQVSGAGTLIYYAPIIFQKAGFESASDAIMQTVIVNIAQLIFTIGAVLLVDRLGRRPLYMVGTAGMAIGIGLIGAFFQFGFSGIHILVVMFLTVGAYVISLAPLTWLLMSEVFPTRIRAKGMAIAAGTLWVTLYLVNQIYPILERYLEKTYGNNAIAFYIFAFFCVCAFIFGWLVIPELKGKTLEQIAKDWKKVPHK